MDIQIKHDAELVPFYLIDVGQTFKVDNLYYLKTTMICFVDNSYCITTKRNHRKSDTDMVKPLKSTLTIED